MTLILTGNKEAVEATSKIINTLAETYWISQGYKVIDGQLIGKNALTGEDEPNSARTLTWDTPRLAPDGSFYIISPTNDSRFVNWKEDLNGMEIPTTEIEMPEKWADEGDDLPELYEGETVGEE